MSQKYNFWSILVFSLVIISFSLLSCQKNEDATTPSDTSKLELYLTDAPGNYQAVWLDIKKVMVRIDDANNSQNTQAGTWQELHLAHSGHFNLLSLRNGNDTLLATGQLPSGTLREISLTFGNDNAVVLNNGTNVNMKTPKTVNSDAKLILDGNSRSANNGGETHHLVVDFDVAKSIHATYNEKDSSKPAFLFIPYTRTFSKEAGGAIEGWVFPTTVQTTVTAISDAHDTLSTQSEYGGYFKLWGLPEGNYTLHYVPDSVSGYKSKIQNNIQVTSGQLITYDTVRLHK